MVTAETNRWLLEKFVVTEEVVAAMTKSDCREGWLLRADGSLLQSGRLLDEWLPKMAEYPGLG